MTIVKTNFVNASRDLINQSQENDLLDFQGLKIKTDPEVFNPKTFFSSQWFAKNVSELVRGENCFIEIGCGTGIVSLTVSKENSDIKIYSSDINPKAKEITEYNSVENNLSKNIQVFVGDVFDSIPTEVKAESIFWSMPFGFLDIKDNLNGRDWQVFDPGYRAIRKFFETSKNYLTDNGRLLIGFSVDIGDIDLLKEIAKENNFSLELFKQVKGEEKETVSMEIWEAKLIK